MRPRSLLSGVAAGIVLASLCTAPAANAANAAADNIVELPVSFTVKNTNRTSVPCSSDGAEYTVRGVMVGPKRAIAAGNAATLYLHAVTWTSEYFNLDIPGHNFARALAEKGHVSIAVDRLGYGKSDKPAGLATCFGSEADVAGQMVDALKSGSYTTEGKAASYRKVFLGGSSVGGMIANIAAFSFSNVDGVINQGFGDFAASPYAGQEVFKASSSCFSGGDTAGQKDYVHFARDTRSTFYFADADTAVRLGVPASGPDPCGQVLSVMAAIGADMQHLAEIDVPVLLAFGDADAVFPPPAMEQMIYRYAGSPKVTGYAVPGASHFPILEQSFGALVATTADWLQANGT